MAGENTDLLLGKLVASLEAIKEDIDDVKTQLVQASDGRRAIHERIDLVLGQVATVDKTLVVVGGQIRQVRDLHDQLQLSVTTEVMPTVISVQEISKRGKNWLVATGFVGSGIAAAVTTLLYSKWDAIWAWIKATF